MSTALKETNGRVSEAESQVKSIANLPPNLAILKMENDAIQSMAAARPRNYEEIKGELLATLKEFPEFADVAIYSKPVGQVADIKCACGHQYEAPIAKSAPNKDYACTRCATQNKIPKDARPRQKFARGLSIRAAEALSEAYGFNRTRGDVMPQPDGTVKIEAIFCDYQKARIWQDAGIVSPFTKWGKTDDDRFHNTIVKAEKSKLIREVIVRSVNAGLKAWFYAECDKAQTPLLTEDKINTILTAFGKFGVTQSMLEDLLGKTRAEGWNEEDKKNLSGVHAGLKNGEQTIADVFGQPTPEKKEVASGPVTAGALTGDDKPADREPGADG